MSDSMHKGGCACGKVRFEARGEPYRVGVCHCLTCRKAHGAPFNFYAVFPTEAVTVTGEVIEFASSEHARLLFLRILRRARLFNYGDARTSSISIPGRSTRPGSLRRATSCGPSRREPWLPKFRMRH